MTNSADPDQKPTHLDLHCLQKQSISRFSRTRVKFSSPVGLLTLYILCENRILLKVLIGLDKS